MGGVSDARGAKGIGEDAPTLTIEGLVIAGGFAVMSELDANGADWLEEMEAKPQAEPAAIVEMGSPSTALAPEPQMTPAS